MCYDWLERLYNPDDPTEEIGIRVHGIGKNGLIEILYGDIPGNSWNQQRLNKFAERAQDFIDVRTPLTDLAIDDPDRTTDPGRADHFWDGSDLVSRPAIIRDVHFTNNSLHFVFERLFPDTVI